jgi:hypothetical protein
VWVEVVSQHCDGSVRHLNGHVRTRSHTANGDCRTGSRNLRGAPRRLAGPASSQTANLRTRPASDTPRAPLAGIAHTRFHLKGFRSVFLGIFDPDTRFNRA